MVYFFVANMYEAKPFLKKLDLKKEESQELFEVYSNQGYMLLVTRPGMIYSAIAVSQFLSQRRPSTKDIIVNIGLCIAAKREYKIGSLYLCYKINEAESGRKLFPDFIFQHPFQESGVTTINYQYTRSEEEDTTEEFETELVDMEASAIFQSVLALAKTHSVYFIKIVSSYGERSKINPIQGERLIEAHIDEIMDWINDIRLRGAKEYDYTVEEIREIKNLSKYLLLSPNKEQELLQYLFYYKTENNDVVQFISEYHQSIKQLDIFTREEGFKYYQELFKKINLTSGKAQDEN